MTFQPAYLGITEHLRHQIIGGELTPGDRLPTEAQLGERFGVSRSTVREALRMLSAERLVSTSRGIGGGTHVARIEQDDVATMLADHIVLLNRSDGCTIEELMDARRMVEGSVVRLAARNRTAEGVERLRATIPAGNKRPGIELRRTAINFHAVLVQLAGNRMLRIVAEPIFQVLQAAHLQPKVATLKGKVAVEFYLRCKAEHVAICEAVAAGDEEAAARQMDVHLGAVQGAYALRTSSGS